MSLSSTKIKKTTAESDPPPTSQKIDIWILLVRAKLRIRLIKGWIFRGGTSRRLTHSVGKRDSCEVRKLFGGHDQNK